MLSETDDLHLHRCNVSHNGFKDTGCIDTERYTGKNSNYICVVKWLHIYL